MQRAVVTKIVFTTQDGKEHTLESEGKAKVALSYVEDPGYKGLWVGRRPSGTLDITMPVDAQWVQGEEGKYLVANDIDITPNKPAND